MPEFLIKISLKPYPEFHKNLIKIVGKTKYLKSDLSNECNQFWTVIFTLSQILKVYLVLKL